MAECGRNFKNFQFLQSKAGSRSDCRPCKNKHIFFRHTKNTLKFVYFNRLNTFSSYLKIKNPGLCMRIEIFLIVWSFFWSSLIHQMNALEKFKDSYSMNINILLKKKVKSTFFIRLRGLLFSSFSFFFVKMLFDRSWVQKMSVFDF